MGLHYSLDPKVLGFRSSLCECLDTKQHIHALKTQFYRSSFLVPKAGLRETSVPQEVCVSPIFSILFGCYVFGTFQLKPKPTFHHTLTPQDPSGSKSDTPVTQMCLLVGHAHFRLRSLSHTPDLSAQVVTAFMRLHTGREKWAV